VGRDAEAPAGGSDEFTREILALRQKALAAYKVPASIRVVTALDVGVSGKLARIHA
jgi:acyl-coenzyme A synthetase/AMP-(fatty) acid ligase